MSFGDELRRERELREISLREIAESTKISLRYLQALEGNRFEELPGGVFNRGFVRAYAQFIGVDDEAMVNAYLLEEQARATEGGGGDVWRGSRERRERGPGDPGSAVDGLSPGSRRGLAIGGLVVVAAIVVVAIVWALLTRGGS